jgi:hypothetical protein
MLSGTAWGQLNNLDNATVTDNSKTSDLAQAAQNIDVDWLAFSIPAIEGTQSPCCWKGDWKQFGESGCHLESRQVSYGTNSDSPIAESLIVFARVEHGNVLSMRVVGDQCPVDGDGATVEWVENVAENAGLDWLESITRSGEKESVRHSALYATALHSSSSVDQRLTDLAHQAEPDLQQQAIFWLGETRGEPGLEKLVGLLTDLPHGETRRQVNFADAQSGSKEASEILIEISKTDADPEQRSGALFWLAQAFPEEAEEILLNTLKNETDPEVLEQTVFAISQLPEEVSGPLLLELARDNQTTKGVRRQALFWLAQSDDEKTIAALTDLLTR